MAVNRLKLKYLAESGDQEAQLIKDIVANPDRLLGVLLLGNNIANIAAASLVTYFITSNLSQEHLELANLLGTLLLTVVVLIFCELAPKIVAATQSEKVSRQILHPIRLCIWLISPFSQLATWCANRLVRLFGFEAEASPFAHALSEEEIRAIIAGSAVGDIAREKKEMLHNIFESGETRIREVMIPRTEVTAVDINDSIADILAVIRKTNYSRLPVYRDSFENILGILYVKDLADHLHRSGNVNIEALLRPAHYVPDSARLHAVLRQLQSMHLHMALVVDEFGGSAGVVTLEDILEEIVGEIRDEHDTEVESILKLGPDLYSVAGNLPVRDFNRFFEWKIPEARDYSTVVGFLQTLTGRLLNEGEHVRYQSLVFTIEKVDGFKTAFIRVRGPASKPAEEPSAMSQVH